MDVYGTICRFHRCLIGAMLRSPPPSCSCGAVLPLHASICPSVSSCFLCIHSQPPARNLSTMFKFHRWVMSRMRYIYIYVTSNYFWGPDLADLLFGGPWVADVRPPVTQTSRPHLPPFHRSDPKAAQRHTSKSGWVCVCALVFFDDRLLNSGISPNWQCWVRFTLVRHK